MPEAALRPIASISPDRAASEPPSHLAQTLAILDNMSDGYFSVDANWRLTFVNRSAEWILDRPAHELVGRILWDAFPGVEVSDFGRMYRAVSADRVARQVSAYFEPHDRWYSVNAHAAPDGLAIYFRDITDRLKVEEAGQRTIDFLATLAHELRNPLAPISNGLHILALSEDNNRTEVLATVAVMQRQLSYMVRLIDDLMDVARISKGKVDLRKERVVLQLVVEDAVKECEATMLDAGHQLEVSTPSDALWLDADPLRLVQVIANLLGNAAKYTPNGGHVTLLAGREGDTVTIAVTDTGIGLAADTTTSIFDLFMQVGAAQRSGLGIGLSLVRQLVVLHGGTVVAHSAGLGLGSTFTIRLPVATDSA